MAGADGVQGSNVYVNWRMGTPPNVVGAAQSFAIAPGTNLLFSAGISNNDLADLSVAVEWFDNRGGDQRDLFADEHPVYLYAATNFSGVDCLHFYVGFLLLNRML